MPFIYPPQPSGRISMAGAMKQGRQSLESELAVDEELGHGYGNSGAWDAMVAEDETRWDDDAEDSDVSQLLAHRLAVADCRCSFFSSFFSRPRCSCRFPNSA